MDFLKNNFVLKGHILYSQSQTKIAIHPHSYLVCKNGLVEGIFKNLPPKYQKFPIQDMEDSLIIPGLIDLHVHAPQYSFRGTGMDLELLDWLNTITFPQEAKYKDNEYAKKAYHLFAEELKNGATTRANIFATIHTPATILLMDMLDQIGLITNVGKVNMDRNAPEILREKSAEESIIETKEWLQYCTNHYKNTVPIITPRFVPACTDELLCNLGKLQKKTGLPVQSHLSENEKEIEWVKELCPNNKNYADVYWKNGLFGGNSCKTVMAHCVYSNKEERNLLKKQGVYVAHCPNSNANLSSGIAPTRTYLQEKINIGLGTDVAGGFSMSIFRAMADAIQMSKLYWKLIDSSKKPITIQEAFFMATKGGGSFFGKVGSFEPGYEFDAVVISDSNIQSIETLSLLERLERYTYLSEQGNIIAKFCKGIQIK